MGSATAFCCSLSWRMEGIKVTRLFDRECFVYLCNPLIWKLNHFLLPLPCIDLRVISGGTRCHSDTSPAWHSSHRAQCAAAAAAFEWLSLGWACPKLKKKEELQDSHKCSQFSLTVPLSLVLELAPSPGALLCCLPAGVCGFTVGCLWLWGAGQHPPGPTAPGFPALCLPGCYSTKGANWAPSSMFMCI